MVRFRRRHTGVTPATEELLDEADEALARLSDLLAQVRETLPAIVLEHEEGGGHDQP